MGDAYRRNSFASDDGSDVTDNVSTISESFPEGGMTAPRHQNLDKNYIAGYLLKKSKDGAWQKRYFETNGTFLTYYKSKKMTKLLAALNMPNVGAIEVVGPIDDALGPGTVFQLELKDRNYVLRAQDGNEAGKWVHKLTAIRDEAQANVIPEEPPSPRNASKSPSSNKSYAGQATKESSPSMAGATEVEKSDWGKSEKKCCCVS